MRHVLIAAMLVAASPAMAQETKTGTADTAKAHAPKTAEAIAADKATALKALDEMGAKLRTLNRFEVNADVTNEEVFSEGQKLQMMSTVKYIAASPNKLYANLRSTKKFRELYYDGQTLTVSAPSVDYYASVPMTGTIHELLDKVSEKYGIEIPLEDLFLWGQQGEDLVKPTDAFRVSSTQIGQHTTDQYFYRAEGVDFQVWIGRDDKIPYRLVITNTDDPAQPQYSANLTWNLAPEIAANQFTFTPTAKSVKIALSSVPVAAGK